MTNKEAVISEVQVSVASDNAIEKALIDAGIDGAAEYAGTNKKVVAMAALKVLKGLLATKSIQEGGYTLTLDIKARILDIETEYGLLPVVVPVGRNVRAVNVW